MAASGRADKGADWDPGADSLPEGPYDGGGRRDMAGMPARTAERRGESTAMLERRLLLETLPGERFDVGHPGRRRSLGLIYAAILLLGGGALALLFVIEDRKQWESSVAALSNRLELTVKEASAREDALRREGAEKDKVIGERKAENQNLAGLAERTLVELKTSLDDLRSLRKENARLEARYREAVEARAAAAAPLQLRPPGWLVRAIDATLKMAAERPEDR